MDQFGNDMPDDFLDHIAYIQDIQSNPHLANYYNKYVSQGHLDHWPESYRIELSKAYEQRRKELDTEYKAKKAK